MARAAAPDLVGVAEIAERAETSPEVIQVWRRRHAATFPAPVATLKQGPVWDWAAVKAWLAVPRRPGRRPKPAD